MRTLDIERLHKVHFNVLNGKLYRGQGTTTYQLVCLAQSLEFVDMFRYKRSQFYTIFNSDAV